MRLASLGFDSLTNGPGLRRVIFFQGCSLACPECFNEHTWDFNGGIEATPQELYNLIDGHVIDKKVTLSGGNPLEQKDLYSLLKLFEAGDYDICVYTGFTYEYCI